MNRIAFDFPMALYVGLPLAVVVLLLFAWSQRRRGIGWPQVGTSLVFRAVALALLVLLASRPVWVEPRDKPREDILLLVDRSGSMSLKEGGTMRYRQALRFAADDLLPALNRAKLRPRAFLFAEDTERVEVPELVDATPDGQSTNLSWAIVRSMADSTDPPLAVIALTDGAANVRVDHAQALVALREAGVPFVGIGFGSEMGVRTLSLRRAIAPPSVPPNQEFRISAQLEIRGAGEMPPFALLLMRNGQLVEKKTVSPGADQRMWLESFAVKESAEGAYAYTVQLLPPAVEGLRCLDLLAQARVRVLENNELRVLFAQGALTWNYKFVRRALSGDQTIRLSGLTRTSEKSVFHQDVDNPDELAGGFPSTMEEIAPFRVVVLSDFRPADLTATQQEVLKRFCGEFGGGVLLIGGPETFDASWQNSPLEQLLPVRFTPTISGLRPAGGSPARWPSASRSIPASSGGSFQLQLTDAALNHPVFKITDRGSQQAAWAGAPTYSSYARVESPKIGAVVWAVHPWDVNSEGQARVLIAQQRYGAGISAAVCLQNVWRWRLAKNSDPRQFDRFWQQFIRYLSEGSGEDIAVSFPDQALRPGVDLRAVIERRPDPGDPGAARQYRVSVEDARGQAVEEETIELVPARPVEFTFRAQASGVHTVKVLDMSRTLLASRPVEIRDTSVEFTRVGRDMDNLQQWASLTAGMAVRAEDCSDAGELVAQVKAAAERPPRHTQLRMPVGVNPWILGLLLGCVCAEWALRKRWGLS